MECSSLRVKCLTASLESVTSAHSWQVMAFNPKGNGLERGGETRPVILYTGLSRNGSRESYSCFSDVRGGCLLSALVRDGGWWLLVSVGFLDTGFSRFLELIHMASSFEEEKENRSGFQVKGLLGWKKKFDKWGAWRPQNYPVCVQVCTHTVTLIYNFKITYSFADSCWLVWCNP